MVGAARWTGILIAGAFVAGAIVAGVGVAQPRTVPDPPAAAPSGPADPQGPLDVARFDGSLDLSLCTPKVAPIVGGRVVMTPASKNHAVFEAGATGNYAVAEVAWQSDEVRDLGAVLFLLHDDLGYAGEASSLDWEYLTSVTGPSPLYLATPIEPDTRYVWSVYPLPGQVIVDLDFESAMSVFEGEPPAGYRVFSP